MSQFHSRYFTNKGISRRMLGATDPLDFRVILAVSISIVRVSVKDRL